MCGCGQTKCCCTKVISKTGKTGPKGPRGPKGEDGPAGPTGPAALPVNYSVKSIGEQPVLDNAHLTLNDPELVINNVPAGTYMVIFDADAALARDTSVNEQLYFNYFINSITARGNSKIITGTTENLKCVLTEKITLAVTTNIVVNYRVSTTSPALTGFLLNPTTLIRLFARSLTLIKIAP